MQCEDGKRSVPVMQLSERCGPSGLVTQCVKLTRPTNNAGATSDAEISTA